MRTVDREVEKIRMTATMYSLETCTPCRGSGWLGTCGSYNLLCETCEGKGLMLVPRCCLRTDT